MTSGPKIAYLLKKFPRLSETFILNELLGLEQLGASLHVFSRRKIDDEPRHPELARLQAEIETLPSRHQLDPWCTLFSEDLDGQDVLRRIGGIVLERERWSHPRLPSLVTEAVHLLERTRALGIEHVHTHFATDSAVVAYLLRELGGPTYSITAHAKDIFRSTVDPRLLNRLFECAEFVVTVCDANVDFLRTRLSPAAVANVRRLYNGIDLERYEAGFPGPDEREPGHVLAVGRLVEKKGFADLLTAFEILRDEHVDCRLTLVGQGDQREALEQHVERARLQDRVTFAGPLDQGRVRELYRRASVFCLPCVVGEDGNRDALPTVLLEALASGLPAISTPVSGVPEILEDGATGPIVPERDPPALADGIRALLASPERRAQYAERGRKRAEQLFDVKTTAPVLFRWLNEAAARCTPPCTSSA
jgi:glycosyltransferase involved in cell wall biosynthesis